MGFDNKQMRMQAMDMNGCDFDGYMIESNNEISKKKNASTFTLLAIYSDVQKLLFMTLKLKYHLLKLQ